MKQSFILNQKGRAEGSYYRKDFLGDVIYNSFYHREFQINFAKKGRRKSSVSDETASFLLAKGLIDEGDLALYLEELSAVFTLETIPSFGSFSIESLYDFLLSFRKKQFGQALLENGALTGASLSDPAHVEMMGLIGAGNNPQV